MILLQVISSTRPFFSSFVSPTPHDLFLESPSVKLQKKAKERIFHFDSPQPIVANILEHRDD